MSNLILPENVQRQMALEARLAHAHAIDEGTVPDPLAERFTVQLQRVSHRLMMVRANQRVPLGCPLKPGFYHLLVHSQDAPINIVPVEENGRYVEPDSRVFQKLASGDITQTRVLADVTAEERARERQAAREHDRAKQERREHLRDVVNAGTRTFVSLDDSLPWTQNAAGRRPR